MSPSCSGSGRCTFGRRRFDIASTITHVFPYTDFPDTYARSSNYKGGVIRVIKSLIIWQPLGMAIAAAASGVAAAAAAPTAGWSCAPCRPDAGVEDRRQDPVVARARV
jgi:hypothetical protein